MSWGKLDRVRSIIGYGDTTEGESATVAGDATETTTGAETGPTRNSAETALEELEPADDALESLLGDVSDVSPDAGEAVKSSAAKDNEGTLEELDEAFGALESMVGSEERTHSGDHVDALREETRFEWVDRADLVAVDDE